MKLLIARGYEFHWSEYMDIDFEEVRPLMNFFEEYVDSQHEIIPENL